MPDELQNERLAQRLRTTAPSLAYPPTPDLARTVRLRQAAPRLPRRRLALRLAFVVLLLFTTLLAVPAVRAAALQLLQIGAIRVRVEPVPSVLPAPTLAASEASATAGFSGATSLAEAVTSLEAPILLPSYPPELGLPDQVFLQDIGGPAIVLVWLDSERPERVRLLLQVLSSRAFAEKLLSDPERTQRLAETTARGQPALWVRGPHLLEVRATAGSELVLRRLVPGDTLIWSEGELTYRLEIDQGLAEARRIAASLRPLEAP